MKILLEIHRQICRTEELQEEVRNIKLFQNYDKSHEEKKPTAKNWLGRQALTQAEQEACNTAEDLRHSVINSNLNIMKQSNQSSSVN